MTLKSRAPGLLVALMILTAASQASAAGAWQIASQYQFPNDPAVRIVAPFVDGDGNPWVLGNHVDNVECWLIGPFNQDDPPVTRWQVEDETGTQPTVCLSLEAGSEDGFILRGFIPPPPFSEGIPDKGFTVGFDDEFDIRWQEWDEPHNELGSYIQPLADVAYSASRNRVLVWFLGLVTVGVEQATQLHAMAVADDTGIVRQVVTSFGRASTGVLQGLLVSPEDGRFLIVVHDNGTTFLLYDGLQSLDLHNAGGQIDWGDESVDYVQYGDAGDDSLYIVHHPRLDFGGFDTAFTRVSGDGESQFYSMSLDKTIVLEADFDVEVEIELPRPILSYVTASTATFVRSASDLGFVLQVFDPVAGEEVAIQPLDSIDDSLPTHLADARSTDRLVLMSITEDQTIRFVNLIEWDADVATPGIIPQPGGGGGDSDVGLGGDDVGAEADVSIDTSGVGLTSGCCAVAGNQLGSSLVWLIAVGVVAVRRRR